MTVRGNYYEKNFEVWMKSPNGKRKQF